MGWFIIARALLVRAIFALHGLLAIWLLAVVTEDPSYWFITASLTGLLFETGVTIYKNKGQEWKWFCPSVLFYLLCIVPAIWMLELEELHRRISERQKCLDAVNATDRTVVSEGGGVVGASGAGEEVEDEGNETEEGGIIIPVHDLLTMIGTDKINYSSEQLVRTLEQLLLLFLILGRWLLPKGDLTHDQLSELLLVYIGTAADICEFLDAFKEDAVKFNEILCMVILSIWSWSLLQFTMVITATKGRSDQSGILSRKSPHPSSTSSTSCCTPEVYGILLSIFMQDAPFLVLRMLLIFKYGVVSYTNMFFTCKNTLVCMLLTYRLVVIWLELLNVKRRRNKAGTIPRPRPTTNSGRMALFVAQNCASQTPDQYYNYATSVRLRDWFDDDDDDDDDDDEGGRDGRRGKDGGRKDVEYVIHRRIAVNNNSSKQLQNLVSTPPRLVDEVERGVGLTGEEGRGCEGASESNATLEAVSNDSVDRDLKLDIFDDDIISDVFL